MTTSTKAQITTRQAAVLRVLEREGPLNRHALSMKLLCSTNTAVKYAELVDLARRDFIAPDDAHPLPDPDVARQRYDFAYIGAVWTITPLGQTLIDLVGV